MASGSLFCKRIFLASAISAVLCASGVDNTWQAVGGAKGLRGKFTAADGEILMDVQFTFTVITFR